MRITFDLVRKDVAGGAQGARVYVDAAYPSGLRISWSASQPEALYVADLDVQLLGALVAEWEAHGGDIRPYVRRMTAAGGKNGKPVL